MATTAHRNGQITLDEYSEGSFGISTHRLGHQALRLYLDLDEGSKKVSIKQIFRTESNRAKYTIWWQHRSTDLAYNQVVVREKSKPKRLEEYTPLQNRNGKPKRVRVNLSLHPRI
jgi:hypothetical protein